MDSASAAEARNSKPLLLLAVLLALALLACVGVKTADDEVDDDGDTRDDAPPSAAAPLG